MKITEYPDGQINVKLTDFPSFLTHRVNSYKNLFILKSIADIYEFNNKVKPIVYIPCLFGQRSDRRFDKNESFDLKIICDFINSCDFPGILILDPHSDVGPALLNNCHVISSFSEIESICKHFKNIQTLVSPDAGAYKKVFKYAKDLNLELVAANKFRNRDGDVELIFYGNVEGKNCLIVDDLADGGYTFHVLAQKLKEQGASKVYLYVTHGYFHKGFDVLKEYIDRIFCTNSIKDINDDFVFQINIIN